MLKPIISTIIVATGLSMSALSQSSNLGSLNSSGAEVYETIEITSNLSPNINFYPRTLHVNQGDTVHLTIRNARTDNTRIFMPSFNIDQEIPKNSTAKIDLCLSNPISKDLWFQINSLTAKKIPGLMVVENFKTPVVAAQSRNIDVSVLNDIINYSKDYCYLEKQPPQYQTPVQSAPSAGVRGYW